MGVLVDVPFAISGCVERPQPRYLESKLFGSYESHEPPLTRADLQIIERIHPTCGWGQIYIVLLDVVNPIINHPQHHHVYPCL